MLAMATVSDDELLSTFAAGDAEAFGAFYRRHLPAVLGFFLRRTADPELTADLTAEVFAAALLAAERYRPGERPALAWLYGIAAHKLADSRRRGRVESEARQRLALEPLAVDDEGLRQLEQLADPGAAELALADLPPGLRDAVVARVLEERSYSEIASQLQCSEMVVRQRVSRGLSAMRTRIKRTREDGR
jgi:RNA polymerase sigma-70 factor (ECF subfamily)